jgi:EF-hand domain-containing family member B
MKMIPTPGVAAYKNECAEAIYESNNKEKLGEGYVRGHVLPGVTKEESFPGFGVKSKEVADGKLVIFPRGVKPDSKEVVDNYKFTHGEGNAIE